MRYTSLFFFVATLACSRTSLTNRPADASEWGQPPDARPCTEAPCLGGHKYLYEVKQLWTPAGGSHVPESESDYQPAPNGGSYLLSFSPDGQTVVVARVAGSNSMVDGAGAVAERTDTSATYKLTNSWAGAELTVSFGRELGCKLTVNGSGLPIVEITRGTMSLTEAYAPVGEACALPPLRPYDQYLSSTYADVLASADAEPVTCAGIRDGYCDGKCAGWLVAILPWRDPPIAAAYDPVTQEPVGWKSGGETYGICRGTFPPLAGDGSPGWNPAKMDRTSGCQ